MSAILSQPQCVNKIRVAVDNVVSLNSLQKGLALHYLDATKDFYPNNSLRLSTQWIATCLAPIHYLNQCWHIVNWTLGDKLKWIFNQNSNILIQANAFENVICKMASSLSQPQCVNWISYANWEIISSHWHHGTVAPWGCFKNKGPFLQRNYAESQIQRAYGRNHSEKA